MPARINHNVHLKQIHRNLALHAAESFKQIGQLASGRRVDRSSDDPASLALANGIKSEIAALSEGSRNIQQSISMLQVADGAMSEINNMIRRMSNLATQSANFTYNDSDRLSINQEFQQLKLEIDRIAESTTYNGITLLAGLETDSIMVALPATLNLASAAGMELGETADVASNILSGMGINASELGVVVDKLAQTGRNANTDVRQLGEAFKMVGPTASTAGMSFNHTTTSLGLLADAGLQGGIGGSSLNSALRAMINPSKEAATETKKLGLSFVDAEGQMLPMDEIIQQMEDSSMSTKQAFQIFGTEGARAMNTLRNRGTAAFRALNRQIEKSGGVAESMAKDRLGSFDGKEPNVFTIQVGPTETSNDVSRVSIDDMRASGPRLGIGTTSVNTATDAKAAITTMGHALNVVIAERNRIGAFQSRLGMAVNTSSRVIERMTDSESSIRDVDLAKSVTALSSSQILAQTASSFAIEADLDIERILSLLQ